MSNTYQTLLMPGFDGTGNLFYPLISALDGSVSATVIKYQDEHDFDDYVTTVAELLPTEDAVLVAESFSGPIALALMARYPKRIKCAVLSATFATSPYRQLTYFAKFVPTAFFGANPMQGQLVNMFCLNQVDDDQLHQRTLNTIRSVPDKIIQSRLDMLSEIDMRPTLQQIQQPILYLQALRDNVVSAHLTRELTDNLPNVIIKKIDGPHLLLQAHPEECADAITAFLN